MAAKLSLILLVTLLYFCTVRAEINLFQKNSCSSYWAYPFFLFDSRCTHNPDVHSNIPTMVTRHGYEVEMHTATTSDGFYLHLYRIPGTGQPVFLQHLVAMNGNIWVDKAERSLAFQLADKGYDVWIGTLRAATYGHNHYNLTRDDNAYWDFTLDNHADDDIPMSLQLVAGVTGKGGEIIYIGHSTGTGLMLMFASWQPEKSASLVKGIVGLATVAYTDGSVFINSLSPFGNLFREALKILGIRSLYKPEVFLQSAFNIVCRFIPHICLIPLRFLYGKDPGQFRPEDLLLYFSAWPVMTGVDEHIQLLQIGKSKRFQRYDHGATKNKELYGQSTPPVYDLSKVTSPDAFAVFKNTQRVYNELGSQEKEMIEISSNGSIPFNHIDFVYPKDADTLLYPEIFRVLDSLAS